MKNSEKNEKNEKKKVRRTRKVKLENSANGMANPTEELEKATANEIILEDPTDSAKRIEENIQEKVD